MVWSLVCGKYRDGKYLEPFMVFDIAETSSPVIIFLVLHICDSITIVVYEGLGMKETKRSVFFPTSKYIFIVWFSTFSGRHRGIKTGYPSGNLVLLCSKWVILGKLLNLCSLVSSSVKMGYDEDTVFLCLPPEVVVMIESTYIKPLEQGLPCSECGTITGLCYFCG